MAILVADVGGTNSRLACASTHGVIEDSVRRFRNIDYRSFEDILAEYMRVERIDEFEACGIAVAGPVDAGNAQLSNIDWEITEDLVRRATSCRHIRLMNDLTALGLSLGGLPPDGVKRLSGRSERAFRNGQALVVGLGTGFNVCPVISTSRGGAMCLEAKAGHAQLPSNVADRLRSRLGPAIDQLPLIEDIFSGRGLSKVFAIATDGTRLDAASVVAAHTEEGDLRAAWVLSLFSQALGVLCKELAVQFLPRDGIYLSGSVSRGVLGAGFVNDFAAEFQRSGRFEKQLSQIPVSIVREDGAALMGCLAAVNAQAATKAAAPA